jgi:Flp pilus assembly pilin Flp
LLLNGLIHAARRLLGSGDLLRRLHRDEQGDEGVNKILIIAMVAVPLIIVLIFFGGQIKDFFVNAWNDLTGKQMDTDDPFSGGGDE